MVSGTFSGINWGKNAKFLQVELDPAGGSSYTDLGTTQMMSVPYALQASSIKMKTSASGDTLYTGGGNYLIIPGISAANPSSGSPNWNGSALTDIDGNVYQTVQIGPQIWMKENLKVSKCRNGDPIGEVSNQSQWAAIWNGGNQTGQAAWCYYNNDAANNTTYGKLYNWYAVADPRGLCPIGWHVPSDHDWNLLTKYLDPLSDTSCADCLSGSLVGDKIKSTNLWPSPNSASNSSGFSGLPGGLIYEEGTFYSGGVSGHWWTSTQYSDNNAWNRRLMGSPAELYRFVYANNGYKAYGFSVRCLKD